MPAQVRGFLPAAVLATVALALAACGDSTEPPALPVCDAPVTVTVGAGTQPEFSWTPACRVEVLAVGRADKASIEWFILADPFTRRAIGPPVRYGVAPAEALDLSFGDPPPLERGTTYFVALAVSDAPDGDDEVGRAEFVP